MYEVGGRKIVDFDTIGTETLENGDKVFKSVVKLHIEANIFTTFNALEELQKAGTELKSVPWLDMFVGNYYNFDYNFDGDQKEWKQSGFSDYAVKYLEYDLYDESLIETDVSGMKVIDPPILDALDNIYSVKNLAPLGYQDLLVSFDRTINNFNSAKLQIVSDSFVFNPNLIDFDELSFEIIEFEISPIAEYENFFSQTNDAEFGEIEDMKNDESFVNKIMSAFDASSDGITGDEEASAFLSDNNIGVTSGDPTSVSYHEKNAKLSKMGDEIRLTLQPQMEVFMQPLEVNYAVLVLDSEGDSTGVVTDSVSLEIPTDHRLAYTSYDIDNEGLFGMSAEELAEFYGTTPVCHIYSKTKAPATTIQQRAVGMNVENLNLHLEFEICYEITTTGKMYSATSSDLEDLELPDYQLEEMFWSTLLGGSHSGDLAFDSTTWLQRILSLYGWMIPIFIVGILLVAFFPQVMALTRLGLKKFTKNSPKRQSRRQRGRERFKANKPKRQARRQKFKRFVTK
jgi:hypothetical protein